MKKQHLLILALRISLGWIFLWAFIDKVFGLGFATEHGKHWLAGVSPTEGFLTHATKGPFAEVFQFLGSLAVTEWIFMAILLGVGLAFIFGRYVKIAAWFGAGLMFLMWLSVLPPSHNPIIDEHIVYALVFLLVGYYKKTQA